MSRQIMTTSTQNAMKETYKKEMRVRLKWHLQNVQSALIKAEALAKVKEKEPPKPPTMPQAVSEEQAKLDLIDKFAPCAKITKVAQRPCPKVEVPTRVTKKPCEAAEVEARVGISEAEIPLKAAEAKTDIALKASETEVPSKVTQPLHAEVPTKDIKELDAEAEEKRMLALVKGLEMKPATPRTKALLYDGIYKLQEGRYRYLKARNKIIPEEKYKYPITTNFEYGWELGKHGTELKKTKVYPRLHLVKDTFYRKNGALNTLNRHDAVL